VTRAVAAALAALTLLAAACGGGSSSAQGPASASANSCAKTSVSLVNPGRLTVATDSPAYSPWFKHNDPSNGQGYESAVAYAVAAGLGFARTEVKWVVEPFNKSYAPGPKDFDFDVNEISITPEREQAVDFSTGYYDDVQALIARTGTPIASARTIADLKPYVLGDQTGTTSLAFIAQVIQPTEQPKVYDTLNDAKAALNAGQIDGIVTDLPTADYFQYSVRDGTVVGRFAASNPPEQFGLLFESGNPLVACVDAVLTKLKSSGELGRLQDQWLKNYQSYPLIQ
jgi:polar amino acid transport system substrate-binding protein